MLSQSISLTVITYSHRHWLQSLHQWHVLSLEQDTVLVPTSSEIIVSCKYIAEKRLDIFITTSYWRQHWMSDMATRARKRLFHEVTDFASISTPRPKCQHPCSRHFCFSSEGRSIFHLFWRDTHWWTSKMRMVGFSLSRGRSWPLLQIAVNQYTWSTGKSNSHVKETRWRRLSRNSLNLPEALIIIIR